MKKTTLLKLALILLMTPSLYSQVTIGGTQRNIAGRTHNITLSQNSTVAGISVIGSGTVLEINGAFTLTNSDATNGTILNGGTIRGTGYLTTSKIVVSNNGMLDLVAITTTGSQTSDLTFGTGNNTLTLSGGGSGAIDMGGGNDNINISSTYTGTLDGGAGTDTLTLNGGTVSGTLSNFESLIILQNLNSSNLNSDLTITGETILATSSTLSGTGHLTTGTISGTGTLNLSQTTITGNQTTAVTFGTSANTLTLAGGGSGGIDMGGGNDSVTVSSTYTGNLDGGGINGGNDVLNLQGGTISGTITNIENLTVGAGVSVLDTNLTLTGGVAITGTLQIATGHVLTTATGTGIKNEVKSGGTLDISKIANGISAIGLNGITILAGGTLEIGTATRREIQRRIFLTKGASEATSSTISLDLGENTPSSTIRTFLDFPIYKGTGKVNLSISGSLAKGATQVLVSGDQTANIRITMGNFELIYNEDDEKTYIKALPVNKPATVLKAYDTLRTNRTIDIDIVESALNTASSAVSVASSAVTSTAMSTNSFITTRTLSLATAKTQGAKGPDKESKLPARPTGGLNYNVWSDFSLGFGSLDSDNESKGYDFDSTTIRMGIDRNLEFAIMGFAFSYTTTSLDNEGTTSESDLTTFSVSFYGSYTKLEKYRIDYLFSIASNDIDISGTSTGSIDSNLIDIDITTHYTGYKEYTPFVSLRLLLNDISSYNLKGTYPMSVEGESYNSFYFSFGTRWDRAWQTTSYKHNLGLKTSLHLNLLDTARETKATFQGGTQPFELQGVEEDSFNIGLGIDYALVPARTSGGKDKLTWLFSYDMFLGSSSQSNHLTIKANYRF